MKRSNFFKTLFFGAIGAKEILPKLLKKKTEYPEDVKAPYFAKGRQTGKSKLTAQRNTESIGWYCIINGEEFGRMISFSGGVIEANMVFSMVKDDFEHWYKMFKRSARIYKIDVVRFSWHNQFRGEIESITLKDCNFHYIKTLQFSNPEELT